MFDVKLFAFTLFCCTSACCIIELLTPENTKKQIRCISGMIILICILSPLKNVFEVDLNFENYYSEQQQSEINVDNILEQEFKTRLKKIIEDKLNSSGIFADDIRIEINISEQQMMLKEITVVFFEYDEQKLKYTQNLLSDYLKTDVKVLYIGGEKNIE